MGKRNQKKNSKRSRMNGRGPSSKSSPGITISGRTLVVIGGASAIAEMQLAPNVVGTTSLGYFDGRLASESDLWQEYRFTRLALTVLPFTSVQVNSAPQMASNAAPQALGFTNVLTNASPTTFQQVLQMPTSECFVASASTAGCQSPPTSPVRHTLRVPHRALAPALTQWLKLITATGGNDFLYQGSVYAYWPYIASYSLKTEFLVDWTCEFRNPVPAVVTRVLRTDLPGYVDNLLKLLDEARVAVNRSDPSEVKTNDDDNDELVVVRRSELPRAEPSLSWSKPGSVIQARSLALDPPTQRK